MLEERIRKDSIERSAEKWRLDHVESYELARSWLLPGADLVVDTGALSVSESVSCILDSVK